MDKKLKRELNRQLGIRAKEILRCMRQGYTLKYVNTRLTLQNPRINSNEPVDDKLMGKIEDLKLIEFKEGEYFLTELGREPLN